jgi:hypothetical protein
MVDEGTRRDETLYVALKPDFKSTIALLADGQRMEGRHGDGNEHHHLQCVPSS